MRYLPLTEGDRAAMLDAIGLPSADALFQDIPTAARLTAPLDLPAHQSEQSVEREFRRLAARNLNAGNAPFFLGGGVYRHHIPASVDHLIQRGEFLTSYTPYQPEIAQGTLQTLFEFQSQVALLTGMEVANASMYDGATACAEAATMAMRITKRKHLLLSGGLHPHYGSVTATTLAFSEASVEALDPDPLGFEDLLGRVNSQTAAVVVQYPNVFGHLSDFTQLANECHDWGALLIIAVTEPVALGLLTSPGEMGADIVVVEGQSLGVGLNFGGPGLGLFATREKYVRQMPGRLIGQTLDADGKRGFVLTLATREQHIRREKATSNICTNSGLCALAFSIHLTLLGGAGLERLARLNHERAVLLAERLTRIRGVRILPSAFFNEFAVVLPCDAAPVVAALAERGILGGIAASRLYPSYPELAPLLLLAATETNDLQDIAHLGDALTDLLREQTA